MQGAQLTNACANERGAALIMTLLVLVLVTMIGMSMLTTAGMEVRMAGSERAFKRDFYLAESAMAEAAQTLENNRKNLDTAVYPWLSRVAAIDSWLVSNGTSPADRDIYQRDNGLLGGQGSMEGAQFSAVYEGVARGANRVMHGEPREQLYTIYGRQQNNATRIMIKAAFLTKW